MAVVVAPGCQVTSGTNAESDGIEKAVFLVLVSDDELDGAVEGDWEVDLAVVSIASPTRNIFS